MKLQRKLLIGVLTLASIGSGVFAYNNQISDTLNTSVEYSADTKDTDSNLEDSVLEKTDLSELELRLSPATMNLSVSETKLADAQILPLESKENTVLWQTSDLAIASVDESGNVSGISEGSCTITASLADNKNVVSTMSVTVTVPEITSQAPDNKVENQIPETNNQKSSKEDQASVNPPENTPTPTESAPVQKAPVPNAPTENTPVQNAPTQKNDIVDNSAPDNYDFSTERDSSRTIITYGGGDIFSQSASEAPQAIQAPQPEQTAPDTNVSDGSYHSDYANEVLRILNEERAKAGLSPLTMNQGAVNAASVRAKEIVSSFSHTRPNGGSPFTALNEAGVSYNAAGENIAYGQKTPSEVMTGWMNSSGHRANILNGNFSQIGIASYKAPDSRYYWVQLFIG